MFDQSVNNTFVVADTHFNHRNMHRMRKLWNPNGYSCESVEEMNGMLIDNWNAAVGPKDWAVVVGDFAWKGGREYVEGLLKALNGRKILVRGNHDNEAVTKAAGWMGVHDILDLKLGDDPNVPRRERAHFVFSHYPMRCWDRMFHGSFHVYGHTHVLDMRDRREFNAGADVPIDPYRPRRLADMVAAMAPRWYPDRGGEPLPDGDAPALFAGAYGKPASIREIVARMDTEKVERRNPYYDEQE